MTATIDVEDTIVAIASPTSPAARGIVRLSGPEVVATLAQMGVECEPRQRPHRFEASFDLGDPLGLIPASVLLWPTRRSYTGQPSAEIHTYGSLPLLSALVESATVAGARAARGGEFTMRAFLAGRLDLTQAEAVLGVIEAEQRGSLDHALRQLAGNLSRPLEQMRGTVLDLLADVEAGLDFVDEDIEFIAQETLLTRLKSIAEDLDSTWNVMQTRGGGAARVVIAVRGQPNAGKSCLINRLSGTDAAIVAEIAGTTRDAVTMDAEIEGKPVKLIDTAGIESADTEISRMAQDQADRASREAKVRLWCVDVSREDFDSAAQELHQSASRQQYAGVLDLWVATKSDLVSTETEPISRRGPDHHWIHCSAQTGAGIDELRRVISAALSQQDREEVGSVVGTAARCRQSLRRARSAVAAAMELTDRKEGDEFVAAELRLLAEALGEVTGAVYTDDILDRVFGRFCIGK